MLKENKFFLPRAIFDDKRLTPSDITVLSYLYSNLDKSKKQSSVSYTDITEGTSISRPTVSKVLKTLEKTGWIKIIREEKNNNQYILNIPNEVKKNER